MDNDSATTFMNGIIAGAGAVVAAMTVIFMPFVAKYEGVMGVSTLEMRIAIVLGALVCVVAVGYEFYRKKPAKQGEVKTTDQ